MKKKLISLLCALSLLFALAAPQAAGAPDPVYLLALNDKMCDLPGKVLPVVVSGSIYVPYTVFDKRSTGVDLGVYYGLNQEKGTVLSLYSLSGTLFFDIYKGVCTDNQGNQMEFRAALRSGIPYVPAAAVCAYFGLTYSFLPTTDRGTLIRISNSSVSMNNNVFLNYSTSAMFSRYKAVLESRGDPAPDPPAQTVTPPGPATPGARENVRVYLAVDASQATEDLTELFPQSVRALFLFSPDTLAAQSTFVRKAVAAGHSVGFWVDGSVEEVRAQLAQANELLSHIARTRTRMVAAPGELTEVLSGEGWSCWQTNLSGTSAATILANIGAKQSVAKATLPGNPSLISRVVPQLVRDGYRFRQPLETDH